MGRSISTGQEGVWNTETQYFYLFLFLFKCIMITILRRHEVFASKEYIIGLRLQNSWTLDIFLRFDVDILYIYIYISVDERIGSLELKMDRHNRPIQKSELDIDRLYRPIQSKDRIGISRSINGTFRPPLIGWIFLRAYSYLRNSVKNCLPSIGTLRKYRNRVHGSPGFSLAALHMIISFEIKSD
jgi:hypothetical protein